MNTLINERVTALLGAGKAKGPTRVELVPVHVREVLNLRRLPARLTAEQTAALLNCGEHDIQVLARHGFLKPLGHPPPNAVKYFAPTEVLELAGDSRRMGQMCDTIRQYWRDKNAAKSNRAQNGRSPVNGEANPKRRPQGAAAQNSA